MLPTCLPWLCSLVRWLVRLVMMKPPSPPSVLASGKLDTRYRGPLPSSHWLLPGRVLCGHLAGQLGLEGWRTLVEKVGVTIVLDLSPCNYPATLRQILNRVKLLRFSMVRTLAAIPDDEEPAAAAQWTLSEAIRADHSVPGGRNYLAMIATLEPFPTWRTSKGLAAVSAESARRADTAVQ